MLFLQLVGHKKPQAPLFAPNLGLLEPMKAPTELQIAQADKDSLTFAISDSSSTSSAAMSSAFSPQVGSCHLKLDSSSFVDLLKSLITHSTDLVHHSLKTF